MDNFHVSFISQNKIFFQKQADYFLKKHVFANIFANLLQFHLHLRFTHALE